MQTPEKRNQQILSNWEFTHVSPEKTHPQKRFEGPHESLVRLVGEDLSLYKIKPVLKTRAETFFKCVDVNTK